MLPQPDRCDADGDPDARRRDCTYTEPFACSVVEFAATLTTRPSCEPPMEWAMLSVS